MTHKHFFLTSIVTLAISILAACGNPHTGISPTEDQWQAGAVGTPRFVKLDDNREDIALFIEGNDRTKNVGAMALAGPGNDDDVVYIVNKDNNSLIGFLLS